MSEETNEGLGRRDVLKRGALLGGAVMWTTPVVQSLTSPAFAAASPPPQPCLVQICIAGGGTTGLPCVGGACFTSTSTSCCQQAEDINTMPTTTPAEQIAKSVAILAFFAGCGSALTPAACP